MRMCSPADAVDKLCCRAAASNERTPPKGARSALLYMRNYKPRSQKSRLSDHSTNTISDVRSSGAFGCHWGEQADQAIPMRFGRRRLEMALLRSSGWLGSSREVRRPNMTTIALSKARGSPRPVRHGDALEGLSDAGQWVLDTLREWLRRGRARHQLAGLGERMLRDIDVTRTAPIHLSNKPFWKERLTCRRHRRNPRRAGIEPCSAPRGLSADGSRGRSTRSGSPTRTPRPTIGRTGRASRHSKRRLERRITR